MATGSDLIVEGFVGGIRLAWAVHLMLIHDEIATRETVSSASSNDLVHVHSCLEAIFSNNIFQFLLDKVLRTAAYQVLSSFSVCNLLRDFIPYQEYLLAIVYSSKCLITQNLLKFYSTPLFCYLLYFNLNIYTTIHYKIICNFVLRSATVV